MDYEVILPKLSANMESAIIVSWLKQVDDSVNAGEPLFEIETEKAVLEVEAEVSGILKEIICHADEEEDIPVTTVIAIIEC